MIRFCSLFSGSSGNSLFIGTEGCRLLIDAGLSGKRVIDALHSVDEHPEDLTGILITHEHSDHTRGAGILSRKYNLPVYATAGTWAGMEADLGKLAEENIRVIRPGEGFDAGGIDVMPFAIPHDAAEPCGFSFTRKGVKVTTATDLGHMNRSLLSHLEGSDLVFLEANHDVEMLKVGPYPWPLKQRILSDRGHLSNEMAGKTIAHLAGLGQHRFFIGHLSKENNFPELAFQTVHNYLNEKGFVHGRDIFLEVALRDRAATVVCV